MAIIAQMVARNEAHRHLRDVLEHLRPMVDCIVFTDDASEDETPEIAHEYGAYVYHMDEPTFCVHEGRLRQQAWNNLENHAHEGDWVLAIDADEKLYSRRKLPNGLKTLTESPGCDVINVDFVHMWNEKQYRVDKAWKPHGSTRFFKYSTGGSYKNREMACGAEPSYVNTMVQRGRFLRNSGLVMQHLGYVRDEDKKAKYERYMKLDGGDFHALNHIRSIMDPNPVLLDWNI